ncbi:MAG: DUF4386 domain-containing protein [Spirochaetaceae bacterium]
MKSINKTAKIAGVIYLLIAVCGGFGFFGGFESLIVPGDANATAKSILDSESMFRLGAVADSFVFLLEIVITVLIFNIFKPVNKTKSAIAAFARLAMTTMIGMNIINKLIVLELLSGQAYLSVFNPDQINALVLLFLNAYSTTSLIWGIFFSLHLLIIGMLIIKSTFFPKVLGFLFLFAAFGYFVDSVGYIILPQFDAIYTMIVLSTIPAELSFALWLTIKGVNVDLWKKQEIKNNSK